MPKGYVPVKEEITVESGYEEPIQVEMHDGSFIRLKPVDRNHDPRKRGDAIALLEQAQREELFLTGLIYYEEPRPTLGETLNLVGTPLAQLDDSALRPSEAALNDLMKSFM
jgi:hypothetical protein